MIKWRRHLPGELQTTSRGAQGFSSLCHVPYRQHFSDGRQYPLIDRENPNCGKCLAMKRARDRREGGGESSGGALPVLLVLLSIAIAVGGQLR